MPENAIRLSDQSIEILVAVLEQCSRLGPEEIAILQSLVRKAPRDYSDVVQFMSIVNILAELSKAIAAVCPLHEFDSFWHKDRLVAEAIAITGSGQEFTVKFTPGYEEWQQTGLSQDSGGVTV